MGDLFDPASAGQMILAEDTARNTRKSAELQRAQHRDARTRQVGMVAEGFWCTVKWDGEWLLIRVSAAAPRLVRKAAKTPERWIHRDDLVEVQNKSSLLGEAHFDVTTRDGKEPPVPYRKVAADDFRDLADQLNRAIRDRAVVDSPAEPAPPAPPANWYPAPGHAGWLRYWDGSAWTEHYHDNSAAPSRP